MQLQKENDHETRNNEHSIFRSENKTAEKGEWKKGPGAELFKITEKNIGKLNIIAEDLGFITPEVRNMLDEIGYPGMKVMQFAFDNGKNEFLPHNYKNTNCFVYTGTHDNATCNEDYHTYDS